MFSVAEGVIYGATNRRRFYSRRPRAQPIGDGVILVDGNGDGGDDDHRHHDDTQGDDEHTDAAQTGWTPTRLPRRSEVVVVLAAAAVALAAAAIAVAAAVAIVVAPSPSPPSSSSASSPVSAASPGGK